MRKTTEIKLKGIDTTAELQKWWTIKPRALRVATGKVIRHSTRRSFISGFVND